MLLDILNTQFTVFNRQLTDSHLHTLHVERYYGINASAIQHAANLLYTHHSHIVHYLIFQQDCYKTTNKYLCFPSVDGWVTAFYLSALALMIKFRLAVS
jgi:hypothetical protein